MAGFYFELVVVLLWANNGKSLYCIRKYLGSNICHNSSDETPVIFFIDCGYVSQLVCAYAQFDMWCGAALKLGMTGYEVSIPFLSCSFTIGTPLTPRLYGGA